MMERFSVGQTFLSVRIREWGHSCPPSGFELVREDKNVLHSPIRDRQECLPHHSVATLFLAAGREIRACRRGTNEVLKPLVHCSRTKHHERTSTQNEPFDSICVATYSPDLPCICRPCGRRADRNNPPSRDQTPHSRFAHHRPRRKRAPRPGHRRKGFPPPALHRRQAVGKRAEQAVSQ